MLSRVHTFDAREGGRFRISLTYENPVRGWKDRWPHGYVPRILPEAGSKPSTIEDRQSVRRTPALDGRFGVLDHPAHPGAAFGRCLSGVPELFQEMRRRATLIPRYEGHCQVNGRTIRFGVG
jgi:hypothetical protein